MLYLSIVHTLSYIHVEIITRTSTPPIISAGKGAKKKRKLLIGSNLEQIIPGYNNAFETARKESEYIQIGIFETTRKMPKYKPRIMQNSQGKRKKFTSRGSCKFERGPPIK